MRDKTLTQEYEYYSEGEKEKEIFAFIRSPFMKNHTKSVITLEISSLFRI